MKTTIATLTAYVSDLGLSPHTWHSDEDGPRPEHGIRVRDLGLGLAELSPESSDLTPVVVVARDAVNVLGGFLATWEPREGGPERPSEAEVIEALRSCLAVLSGADLIRRSHLAMRHARRCLALGHVGDARVWLDGARRYVHLAGAACGFHGLGSWQRTVRVWQGFHERCAAAEASMLRLSATTAEVADLLLQGVA